MLGRGTILALASVLTLSACIGGNDVTRAGTSPFWFNAAAPRAVVLASNVVVNGPKGYCIDPKATQNGDGVYFVLLGSCASLSNSASHGKPSKLAAIAISLGQTGGVRVSTATEALANLLSSSEGRGLLANDGASGTVSVMGTEIADGAVLVQANDPGLTQSRNLEPTYWRGFFDLKDRIATVSVFSLPSRSLSDSAGRKLLVDTIAALRAANASEPQQPEGAAEG